MTGHSPSLVATTSPSGHTPSAREALEPVRTTTRDQLEAAWQLHVDRVQRELARGWAEDISRVLEERFEEIAGFLEEAVERLAAERVAAGWQAAAARGAQDAGRRLTERLNQAGRRLRQAGDIQEWTRVLLEVTRDFSPLTLLFRFAGDTVRLERAAGDGLPEQFSELSSIELATAPAFRTLLECRDTVIALATQEEISPSLAARLPPSIGRVALVPIMLRGKVVAALFAAAEEEVCDLNALELVAGLASAALETRPPAPDGTPGGFVLISGLSRPGRLPLPPWSSLSKEDQEFHLKAQRFARVCVAELRLYESEAVKQGRAAKDLYARLKEKIDAGREAYRRQFMDVCPSMVDYLHLELVHTLANDDETLLGTDYPGPLV